MTSSDPAPHIGVLEFARANDERIYGLEQLHSQQKEQR